MAEIGRATWNFVPGPAVAVSPRRGKACLTEPDTHRCPLQPRNVRDPRVSPRPSPVQLLVIADDREGQPLRRPSGAAGDRRVR